MVDRKNEKQKTIEKKVKIGTSPNYSVGDFLMRIKNTGMASKKTVLVRKTKLSLAVAEVLKRTGIIRDIIQDKEDLTHFSVSIAYSDKQPLFTDIKIVSKPGLRVYVGVDDLGKHKKPSTLIISTPRGILTSKEAIKENCGGEVIAEIY